MTTTSIKATLHLLFQGTGAAALTFYTGVFPDLTIQSQTHRANGSMETTRFQIGGLNIQIHDDTHTHAFGFTPATSIFLDLSDKDQQAKLVEHLSTGGKVMMPLDNYGFSQAFAWVEDRFGISWQLNLA